MSEREAKDRPPAAFFPHRRESEQSMLLLLYASRLPCALLLSSNRPRDLRACARGRDEREQKLRTLRVAFPLFFRAKKRKSRS